MKHKIFIALSAIFISLTMTSCGSSEPAETPSVAQSDKSIVQEKLNKNENSSEKIRILIKLHLLKQPIMKVPNRIRKIPAVQRY